MYEELRVPHLLNSPWMHDSILNMECDHLRKHFVFTNANTYDDMKNTSRYNENSSAQLRIPIVCLRAWQFGQSVKPKVNISPCPRLPNVCPWLRLRVSQAEDQATILGPFLGQRPRSSSANTELSSGKCGPLDTSVRLIEIDARLTRCDLITVIASSDGETKWSVEEKGRNIDIKWSQKDHLKWSDLNSMRKNKWMAKCLRKQYQFYKLSGLS